MGFYSKEICKMRTRILHMGSIIKIDCLQKMNWVISWRIGWTKLSWTMGQLEPLLHRKYFKQSVIMMLCCYDILSIIFACLPFAHWIRGSGMRAIRIVVHALRLPIVKLAQLLCKSFNWKRNTFGLERCSQGSIIRLGLCRKRVFILGPSHHVRLRGCALSIADRYETPLYDLKIDTQLNAELEKTGKFSWMEMSTDENEHSIEMHLPYIAKVMEEWVQTIMPCIYSMGNHYHCN